MKCSPVETFLQHFKQKHDLSMFRNKFQPGSVRTVEHPSWWEFVQWLKSNKLHPERWWLCNDMWRSHKCGNPKKHCWILSCFYNASMLLGRVGFVIHQVRIFCQMFLLPPPKLWPDQTQFKKLWPDQTLYQTRPDPVQKAVTRPDPVPDQTRPCSKSCGQVGRALATFLPPLRSLQPSVQLYS